MDNPKTIIGTEYILFTTPTCPNCIKAIQELEKTGLPYKNYNANDIKYKDIIMGTGVTCAPCLVEFSIANGGTKIFTGARWENLSEIIGFCKNIAKKR